MRKILKIPNLNVSEMAAQNIALFLFILRGLLQLLFCHLRFSMFLLRVDIRYQDMNSSAD